MPGDPDILQRAPGPQIPHAPIRHGVGAARRAAAGRTRLQTRSLGHGAAPPPLGDGLGCWLRGLGDRSGLEVRKTLVDGLG